MDLEDEGSTARFLIRDRDGKYPALFDAILADAGIQVVFTGVRIPRMNAIMERWIRSCRHELLDRMLIWNQSHLLHTTTGRHPQRVPRRRLTSTDDILGKHRVDHSSIAEQALT